jgi:hypothetical protein
MDTRRYSSILRAPIRVLDRFSALVEPFESKLVLAGLIVATLLAAVYSSEIFEVYPTCTSDVPCDYTMPVYVGDEPPQITWDARLWDLAAIAMPSDIEMQNLLEAGLSGTLVDPMMASGFLATLIALWLSLPLDRRFHELIRQLEHDQLIPASSEAAGAVNQLRRRLAWGTSGLVALIIFVGVWGWFDGNIAGDNGPWFLFGCTLLGAISGQRLGSAAAYGRFSVRFHLGSVRLLPGHADKMGGWQRLGEFFAFEAVILLIPAIWLSTWLYIELQNTELFWTCERVIDADWPALLAEPCYPQAIYNAYVYWVLPQSFLFIVIAFVLYKAFLRPLFDTTRAYRRIRATLRDRYDAVLAEPLRRAVKQLESAQAAETQSLEEERKAMDEIGKLSALREEIWAMPPVPMRTAVTGVFSLSALYPLITLFLAWVLPAGASVGNAMELVIGLFKAL